ncbi:hypothetical protein ACI2JA_15780 [Alkalihalobacillus sp. NPDC078783]
MFIIKSAKFHGEEVQLSEGLKKLLGSSKAWGTEGRKDIPGYKSTTFKRDGQFVTRITKI